MIIYATSIHSGGGKVLLDQLILEEKFGKIEVLVCDYRYQVPDFIQNKIEIYRIKPNLISRWKAEFTLKTISIKYPKDSVLCFSNLPPALKLENKVILYLQNALLLPNIPLYSDSLKVIVRLTYEKIWAWLFWKNVDEIWVQTPWMKNALIASGKLIKIEPFLPQLPVNDSIVEKKYDFITISGTASHKRLLHLLRAWKLFTNNRCPSLLVITDGTSLKFDRYFSELSQKNVTVKCNVSRNEIFNFYRESKNLIVTSKLESFCLPIYEGKHFKLKIFAVDEPYARDSEMVDVYIDISTSEKLKSSIENNYT